MHFGFWCDLYKYLELFPESSCIHAGKNYDYSGGNKWQRFSVLWWNGLVGKHVFIILISLSSLIRKCHSYIWTEESVISLGESGCSENLLQEVKGLFLVLVSLYWMREASWNCERSMGFGVRQEQGFCILVSPTLGIWISHLTFLSICVLVIEL